MKWIVGMSLAAAALWYFVSSAEARPPEIPVAKAMADRKAEQHSDAIAAGGVHESPREPALHGVAPSEPEVSSAEAPNAAAGHAEPSNRTPPDIHEALAQARRWGRVEGIDIPKALPSAGAQRSIIDSYVAFLGACSEIDAIRMPALNALSDAKKARGEVERVYSSREMPVGLSRAERLEWQRAVSAARAPTRPGQVVVHIGQGGRNFVVRIDPSEDPRLQWSHEKLESEKRLYVQRVRLALDADK
jgi:hypothetical protein